MDFGERLRDLRQKMRLSQEALAEAVGVSRQAVSKWEAGQSFPDLDKLLQLSGLFQVTLDDLVGNSGVPGGKNGARCGENVRFHYEYKSKRTLFGIPLIHVNIGSGRNYRAKGIVAVGNIASGVVSLGALSAGLVSFGALSLGLVSLGGLAAGLFFALGGIAAGILAVGGIAFGIFAVGGLALGMFSLGGCAVAARLAAGEYARGHIAVGNRVSGIRTVVVRSHFLDAVPKDVVRRLLAEEYPHLWKPVVDFILLAFR